MRSFFLLLSILAVGVACGDPQPGDTDPAQAAEQTQPAEQAQAATAPADTGLIQNTPEGGVLDWLADIQAGLDSVPALAGDAPSTAQGVVLNLYVLRQEYLEMYYGQNGRLETTPELADAIETAEGRFHVLMEELAKEAPDSARVEALTDSLSAQVAAVRSAAQSVGRELTPWPTEGS